MGLPRFQNRITPATSVTSSGPSQPDQRVTRSASAPGTPRTCHIRGLGATKGGTRRSRTSPLASGA
ncbi:hypothetical protein M2162_004810 [Streptomyces sp. SAI-041]|nr:hypothetical protein [Streptomyces sp. SAI-041]